jgi:hypothetical protein
LKNRGNSRQLAIDDIEAAAHGPVTACGDTTPLRIEQGVLAANDRMAQLVREERMADDRTSTSFPQKFCPRF